MPKADHKFVLKNGPSMYGPMSSLLLTYIRLEMQKLLLTLIFNFIESS